MLTLAILSYLAGLLTALAPCVLPLLPVIVGGSVAGDSKKDTKRPYIITLSLVLSLIIFTILLKASTALIGIDPRVWTIGSGLLVIALGGFMLVPDAWFRLISAVGIEHRSQNLLGFANRAQNKNISAILTGAALGPIFSSCSPTYAWVIATVLPAEPVAGVIYLAIYCAGVASSLLAIALLGRRLLSKIGWAANPYGWFQRVVAVLFIVVGVLVITGWDKRVQTYLVDKDIFSLISLEQQLVPGSRSESSAPDATYNVQPYPAPEFTSLTDWQQSEPLTIESLKGKVVLVDFWTYSCINCQRTQPYLNAWYEKYRDKGLVIVGVHAPEFSFERLPVNVARAIDDAGIKYPVALDNDFATWRAYDNQFWPAKYVIDRTGQVRYTHFGEGDYDVTEKVIQDLLGETAELEKSATSNFRRDQTSETYLGYERSDQLQSPVTPLRDAPQTYRHATSLASGGWSLQGDWQINNESIQSLGDLSRLRLRFSAKEVYLVMSGKPGSVVTVNSPDQFGPDVVDRQVLLDGARLYRIVAFDNFVSGSLLDITVPTGVTLHAFTFGS